MRQVDLGHHLEQFASQMGWISGAGRRHADLDRIGFGIGNEFGNGLGWNGWERRGIAVLPMIQTNGTR
jgi:hypothetical protein